MPKSIKRHAPWWGAGDAPCEEVLQNYEMISEPSQIIEALIKGKRVRHDGHRVLRWCWKNAAIKSDRCGAHP
jgi:phage terminase large subunit-like protein